jgi:hypothetical protein
MWMWSTYITSKVFPWRSNTRACLRARAPICETVRDGSCSIINGRSRKPLAASTTRSASLSATSPLVRGRPPLDYIVEARNNQTGANVVAASEIHAEIESLVQCLERTTKCNLYNILPMLKFKLFAIEIKDKQANC